jgi:hypothetical protein
MDAGLIISGLKLLLDGYKLASEKLGGRGKDDPDPEKLEEVIADVQASTQNGPPDPARVDQQIDQKFSPEQARKIKSDLAAFALLADPPRMEEFDYWTGLVLVSKSMQGVAKKAELFGLLGQLGYDHYGRYLPLKKTSGVFAPPDITARSLPIPNRAYGKEIINVFVSLFESDLEIPLRFGVVAKLKYATSMGEQYSETVGGTFSISAGAEKNRLRLTPDKGIGYFVEVEYRVTAAEVTKIIEAMRSDVSDYLDEISKERDLARDLAENVREMLTNLSDKLS